LGEGRFETLEVGQLEASHFVEEMVGAVAEALRMIVVLF